MNPNEQQPDPWFIAESEEDGLPLIFRVREITPVGVVPERYGHLVSVLWQFEQSASGMPADDVLERMNDFEDRLDQLEGSILGYMMVSITGNGRKEWLWYVSNTANFMQGVNRVLASAATAFPVDFQASEDPAWQAYRSFVEGAQSAH